MNTTLFLLVLLLSPALLAGEADLRAYKDTLEITQTKLKRLNSHSAHESEVSCPFPKDKLDAAKLETDKNLNEIIVHMDELAKLKLKLNAEEKAKLVGDEAVVTEQLKLYAASQLSPRQVVCQNTKSNKDLNAKSNPVLQRQLSRDTEADQ